MMLVMIMLAGFQEAEPTVHRLVVTAGAGITTKDYPTVEACEAARTKIIQYNRRRTDEEVKRDKSDRVNHIAVAAACIPL